MVGGYRVIMTQPRTAVSTTLGAVLLARHPHWSGIPVRTDGDMTLVDWTTGTLAGEQHWTMTDGLITEADWLEGARSLRAAAATGRRALITATTAP